MNRSLGRTNRRIQHQVLAALLGCAEMSLFASAVRAQDPPGTAIPLADVELDESKLRVHFIDIGPGLAMLIETPGDRRHIFIDGGKWGLDGLQSYLERFVHDVTSSGFSARPIDAAIVTHADSDHYKGLSRLLKNNFRVGEFWYTGYESDELDEIQGWGELLKKIEAMEGCEVYVPIGDYVDAGDREVLDDGGTPDDASDDVIVQYLNVDADPPERDPVFGRRFSESQRRNNASLVLKIIYGDVSFLVTGDINGRNKDHKAASTDNEIDSEELELWVRHTLDPDRYGLKATVLPAPHHGSNGSCSLPFLKAVDPEWVVITAGHQFNHPHPAALRRIR
ncbi:MAG: MBL fold metallo-hydrolase, partial [Phycisphaerae bacterium]